MPIWAASLISIILLAAAALVLRLWRRARATGGTAEYLIVMSISFFALGCASWVYAASMSAAAGPGAHLKVTIAAEGFLGLGAILFFVATWRVFRPNSKLAGAFVLLQSLALSGAWLYLVWRGQPFEPSDTTLAPAILSLSRALCLVWWGVESAIYYLRMRRRVAVGLTAPDLAIRFLYQAVGFVCLGCAMSSVFLTGWLLGRLPREEPAVLAVVIVLAVVGAAGFILAILPNRHGSQLETLEQARPRA